MELNSYGIKFIFDENNNKKIPNFNWFIGVLKEQTWEPKTFETFNNLKDINKIAIDIGGWIGPTTIYLSKIFKEVITIEADTVAFEALSNNIKDNSCNNVVLYNKAFHNSKTKNVFFGTNRFNFESELGSSTSQTKNQIETGSDYSIDTINIFNIIENIDPKNIGLIKVDIEGGDENIFEELIFVGSNYGWKIWISFHYGWWGDKNVKKFEHVIKLIKKVSRDDIEISKHELLSLIELNVPESFLIEL